MSLIVTDLIIQVLIGQPVKNVQAKMRIAVKKILRKHGYPPGMEFKAKKRS